MIQKWYTKARQEREDGNGWLFEVHQDDQPACEQFLYDEALPLRRMLGGFPNGGILVLCWEKDYWFMDDGDQCYVMLEGNPLSVKGPRRCRE